MLALFSWVILAGFIALLAFAFRRGLAWSHLPGPGDPRTEFSGLAILYIAAIFLFAWLAPSANPIFRMLSSGGNVIASLLAIIGVILLMLGRAG